jgi:hypothetical protein
MEVNMQVEILTRQMEKKTAVLTLLSNEPGLHASGETITVPGLILHIAENYLLFNITSVKWIEHIVPLLFSIVPAGGTGQFYEPFTDMKIIVTARCFDPVKLLPSLHEVSHLDLDHSELLGTRFAEWRSRDVTIVARAELAVQGNVITARIKFSSHFRDSQYNCRACIDQVSLLDLLEPLCPEFTRPVPERQIYGPVIQAQQRVTPEGWAEFINLRPAPINYHRETDEFRIDFNESGYISFTPKPDRREIMCRVELTDPGALNAGMLGHLHNLLNVETLTVSHNAENIVLTPEKLIHGLSFFKTSDYHLFILKTSDFDAVYNIKNLRLTLNREFKISENGIDLNVLSGIYDSMKRFMEKVIAYAGAGN